MGIVLQRAVMFADLVGSTSLYERLGDVAAKPLVDECLRGFSKIVRSHGGEVIKTLGDEVMASFEQVAQAAAAAIAMQTGMRDGARFGVRIGFHWGDVIAEDNDVFGDAVNVAARLAGAARGGQILTSEPVAAQLVSPLREMLREYGEEFFKGKSRAIGVFELVWEAEDNVTRMTSRPGAIDLARALLKRDRLVLMLRGRSVSFTSAEMPIAIGRDISCQLEVPSVCASRVHARCEYHRGKFVLSDHSTNGTYVAAGDSVEVFLRRESMPLTGHGTISLGCPAQEQPELVLRYSCDTAPPAAGGEGIAG
jgi:class 3 adenylate cyclase